ncbi:AI-2E family transporter, partial [Streptomyces sp. SID7958]|nr:AI-2E family transporter [Streptomyces sp. SID7958]
MSRVPGWLGRVGAGLTAVGKRLDERRAEVEREDGDPSASAPAEGHVPPPPDYAPAVPARPD